MEKGDFSCVKSIDNNKENLRIKFACNNLKLSLLGSTAITLLKTPLTTDGIEIVPIFAPISTSRLGLKFTLFFSIK